MAKFVIKRPVTTRGSSVKVDGGLAIGRHRFQLVVVDSQGNKSRPAIVTVLIKGRRTIPIAPRVPIAPIAPRVPVIR